LTAVEKFAPIPVSKIFHPNASEQLSDFVKEENNSFETESSKSSKGYETLTQKHLCSAGA